MRTRLRNWYMYASGMDENSTIQVQECDETDGNGVTRYWIEPLLPPPTDNVCVVEYPIGNTGWGMRFELMTRKIKSVGGL